MGLGMLVDNGIVVVENVYRLMDEEGMTELKPLKELEKLPSLSLSQQRQLLPLLFL